MKQTSTMGFVVPYYERKLSAAISEYSHEAFVAFAKQHRPRPGHKWQLMPETVTSSTVENGIQYLVGVCQIVDPLARRNRRKAFRKRWITCR